MMVEPTGISEKIQAPDGIRTHESWVRIPSGAWIFYEIPVGSTIISFLMCLYHSHIYFYLINLPTKAGDNAIEH